MEFFLTFIVGGFFGLIFVGCICLLTHIGLNYMTKDHRTKPRKMKL